MTLAMIVRGKECKERQSDFYEIYVMPNFRLFQKVTTIQTSPFKGLVLAPNLVWKSRSLCQQQNTIFKNKDLKKKIKGSLVWNFPKRAKSSFRTSRKKFKLKKCKIH